jgi:hypothetical protein
MSGSIRSISQAGTMCQNTSENLKLFQNFCIVQS